MKPTFFATPGDLEKWLSINHAKADKLLIGFYKKGSGKPSMTWEESVEVALCYGWIDGVRKGVDDKSYTIRFSPRRPGGFWSKKNIASIERLKKEGRMPAAGLKAFEGRLGERSGVYSFEQEATAPFNPAFEQRFIKKKGAWDFFSAQPPGYQKTMRHWVISAKQEATQLKRLDRLIEVSTKKKRVDLMSPFTMTQDQRKRK